MNNISFDNLEKGYSLGSKVFGEIEKSILNGTLRPGDSLIETKLCQELGVSRTPVREAVRQLELEGLVKIVPNKGAVVIGFSQKDIEDIYIIRMYIEGLASRWAAENITDEELSELENLLELQEFYANKGDYIQVWHLDTKFHFLIYSYCKSHPLKKLLSSFHHYVENSRQVSLENPIRMKTSVEEHREIFDAIKSNDGEKAEKLTKNHISNAMDNMLKNIK